MIKQFYSEKLKILKSYNIDNPELDLKLLIKGSVKKKYNFLHEISMSDIDTSKFNLFFNKRINKEPISKIFRNKEFWDLNFYINKNVLDPRPETEIIVETVVKYYNDKSKKLYFCDLGTGSGCIIITLLKNYKRSKGIAIDISKNAIKIAKKNAENHKVLNRLNLKCSNWNNINLKFDIIVSNPPYIKIADYANLQDEVRKFDPKLALVGGSSGLEKFLELAKISNYIMHKNSLFIVEIGFGQKEQVKNIFKFYNLKLIDIIKDYAKIDRVLVFKKMA
ncbi:MAG: protein-(glutamine-N5) methyltransferase, release factor-specific [Pelagibacteraceae bacterium]|nr:protein-(glutamine-N5) methyltransferase, release factor-specific [Pelagibacteraceae bacterium]PPR49914.1 MAG: Release factor glutamine methyltransferase [Alphaproteobacteria bacterium MarineAlpha5_Bin10]